MIFIVFFSRLLLIVSSRANTKIIQSWAITEAQEEVDMAADQATVVEEVVRMVVVSDRWIVLLQIKINFYFLNSFPTHMNMYY